MPLLWKTYFSTNRRSKGVVLKWMVQPILRNSSLICRGNGQRQAIIDMQIYCTSLYLILNCYRFQVAFYIFTYGKQTLGLNLSERFAITDEVNWAMPTMYWITPNMQLLIVTAIKHIFVSNKALENMPWPEMRVSESQENMFKSKLRFQIRHGDFRQRISQDEEDINSILNW